MLSISSYDPDTLTIWKAIKGYPANDERAFRDAFGFPALDWMGLGRVWQNSHGGNQNCFYLCHVRALTKGMTAQLATWCEQHDLWFCVEGRSIFKPNEYLAICVVRFEHEFEYA